MLSSSSITSRSEENILSADQSIDLFAKHCHFRVKGCQIPFKKVPTHTDGIIIKQVEWDHACEVCIRFPNTRFSYHQNLTFTHYWNNKTVSDLE